MLLLCCGLNGQPHKLEEGGSAWNQHESCRETMTPPLWLHSSPALPPATEGTHTHTQRAVPRELVTTRVPPRRAQAEATSCMCPWPHACTCLFCRLLPKAHLCNFSGFHGCGHAHTSSQPRGNLGCRSITAPFATQVVKESFQGSFPRCNIRLCRVLMVSSLLVHEGSDSGSSHGEQS